MCRVLRSSGDTGPMISATMQFPPPTIKTTAPSKGIRFRVLAISYPNSVSNSAIR